MRSRPVDILTGSAPSFPSAPVLLATGLLLAAVMPAPGHARGLTTKPDEKRVVRVVRLTHPSYSYIETHHSSWNAFNLANDRVLLWQATPTSQAEWGYLSELTSWTTQAGFEAARHPIPVAPNPPSGGISPRWSEIPGENDILYSFNKTTGYVLRVDLTAGTCVNWVPLSDTGWGSDFELPGFSSDGKFIVWVDFDNPSSAIWEVEVVARTAVRVPSPPARWSADWKRYPLNPLGGHIARSPDATMIFGSEHPADLAGYQGNLQREGQASLGLTLKPAPNHVCWRNTNSYAVFGAVDQGNLYQIWTDGTFVKLLDVRLSDCPVQTSGCYYHNSSYPNLNRNNSGILYTSDGGDMSGNISVFYAYLEDANAGNPVGIASFTADPAVTLAGKQVKLTWSTANATKITISPKPTLQTTGAATVKPTKTTTYTLTAEGPQGPVTKTVTVQVVPSIGSSLVLNGSMESGTLGAPPDNWGGIGNRARTLSAMYDFTSACEVIAATPLDQAKVVQSLTAANAAQAQGHRVKLSAWIKSTLPTGHHGDFLNIGYGNPTSPTVVYQPLDFMVPPTWTKVEMATTLPSNVNGFVYVTVSGATGYQYTKLYIDRVELKVEDVPPPPVIQSFSSNPASIPAGNAVALSWSVSGAASVSIDGGVGAVEPGAGTVVLGAGLPAPTSTRVYTLTANNGFGGVVTRQLTVNVTPSSVPTPVVDLSRTDLAITPGEFRLDLSSPNPGRGPASFRFILPRPGRVTLTLYDVQGRQLRRLVDGSLTGGEHVVPWDGRGGDGRNVSNGLYFATLEWGGRRLIAKLARLE